MKVLQSIKDSVKIRNKKYKDLSFALNMPYTTLSRIINGFDRTPKKFEENVADVLRMWDMESKSVTIK